MCAPSRSSKSLDFSSFTAPSFIPPLPPKEEKKGDSKTSKVVSSLTGDFKKLAIPDDKAKELHKLLKKLRINVTAVKKKDCLEMRKTDFFECLVTISKLAEIPAELAQLLREAIHCAIQIDPNFTWCANLLSNSQLSNEFALALEAGLKKVCADSRTTTPYPEYSLILLKIINEVEFFRKMAATESTKTSTQDLLLFSFISLNMIPKASLKSASLYGRFLIKIPSLDSKKELRSRYFAIVKGLLNEKQKPERLDKGAYKNYVQFASNCLRYAMEMHPSEKDFKSLFDTLFTSSFAFSIVWELRKKMIFRDETPAEKLLNHYCLEQEKRIRNTFLLSLKAIQELKKLLTCQPHPEHIVKFVIKQFEQLKNNGQIPSKGHLAQLDRIFMIYDNILSAPLSQFEHGDERIKLFKVAIVCQELSSYSKDLSPIYFTRHENELDNPIIFYPKYNDVLISAEKSKSVLKGKGGVKVVRSALLVSLANSRPAQVVARLFTKQNITKMGYERAVHEMSIYRQFMKKPGIVQIVCGDELKIRGKGGYLIDRLECIFEWFRTDLCDAIGEPTLQEHLGDLSDWNNIAYIAKGSIDAVFSLHQDGYLHCDLKPHNMLISKSDDPAKKFHIAVGDLAYALLIKNGDKAPDNIYSLFHVGYYGTPEFTAPELFGIEGFRDDYFKLDVWALGTTLYYVQNKKLPPWSETMRDSYETKAYLRPEEFKKIKDQVVASIQSEIENHSDYTIPLDEKKKGSPISLLEEIDLLIYSMLRIDPADRITITEAKAEIERIFRAFSLT